MYNPRSERSPQPIDLLLDSYGVNYYILGVLKRVELLRKSIGQPFAARSAVEQLAGALQVDARRCAESLGQ